MRLPLMKRVHSEVQHWESGLVQSIKDLTNLVADLDKKITPARGADRGARRFDRNSIRMVSLQKGHQNKGVA